MKKLRLKKVNIKKMLRRTMRTLYWVIFAGLLCVAGMIAVSSLEIPGNYKLLVVQSGSMEPVIPKGAVVVIKPADEYQSGEVITVAEPANPKVSLTHRVTEVKEREGKTWYVTKGDANNTPDSEERPKENVLGKVLFAVPLIGYPIGWAKTRDGLIFLIVVPATIIVYSELMSIKKEAAKLLRARKKRKLTAIEKIEVEIGEEEMQVERGVKKWWHKIIKLIPLLVVVGITQASWTKANLSDQERSAGNVMTAATWVPSPQPSPVPSPSDQPDIEAPLVLESTTTATPSPDPSPIATASAELAETTPEPSATASVVPSPEPSPEEEIAHGE